MVSIGWKNSYKLWTIIHCRSGKSVLSINETSYRIIEGFLSFRRDFLYHQQILLFGWHTEYGWKKINTKCILFKLKSMHHIQMQQLNGCTRTIYKLLIPQQEDPCMHNEMESARCQSSRLLAAFAFWYTWGFSKICYVRKEISGIILLFLVENATFLYGKL